MSLLLLTISLAIAKMNVDETLLPSFREHLVETVSYGLKTDLDDAALLLIRTTIARVLAACNNAADRRDLQRGLNNLVDNANRVKSQVAIADFCLLIANQYGPWLWTTKLLKSATDANLSFNELKLLNPLMNYTGLRYKIRTTTVDSFNVEVLFAVKLLNIQSFSSSSQSFQYLQSRNLYSMFTPTIIRIIVGGFMYKDVLITKPDMWIQLTDIGIDVSKATISISLPENANSIAHFEVQAAILKSASTKLQSIDGAGFVPVGF